MVKGLLKMSANYNFLNLDSYEFEQLCSDVLSVYLNKSFRVFAPGPDGGIDIKQENGSEEIIGQAKRHKYPQSDYSDELSKLKTKQCKKYYFFIACPLSASKRTSIFNCFEEYMEDETHVFDSIKLNELLDEEKYQHVLLKHFRLWAASEKMLRILMPNSINFDTSTFIENVKKHQKYYVETSEYISALKTFYENRVILIKGDPGVGKSTTSEMIVLSFLNKFPNARFLYSSSGNIEALKSSISIDSDICELVYIDDFLGDIILSLRGDKISNIVSFVNYFKNCKNKYLIINTRVVILNDAQSKFIDFDKTIKDVGIKQIELKNLTKSDKSLILYNHIYFSDISDEDKTDFLNKKLYKKIVEHKNYNPRLIETICNKNHFELSGLPFEKYVIDVLNNQEKTWKHSFENNLLAVDRILLHILYSFGSQFVSLLSLEKAFRFEAKKRNDIDLSADVFNQSIRKLNGSFIYIEVYFCFKYVRFLNPSVKECIKNMPLFFDKMSDFSFIDQYFFIWGITPFLESKKFKEILYNNKLDDYNVELYSKQKVYALYFSKFETLDIKLEDKYFEAHNIDLKNGFVKIGDSYCKDIFINLINDNYLRFYDLSKFNEEQVNSFAINSLSLLKPDRVKKVFKLLDTELLSSALDDEAIKIIVNSVYSEYDKSNAISNGVEYVDYGNGLVETFDEDRAKEYAVSEIYSEIECEYGFLMDTYSFYIDEDDVDNLINSSDFKNEFNDCDDHEDSYDKIYESDDDRCYDIFQRLLDK